MSMSERRLYLSSYVMAIVLPISMLYLHSRFLVPFCEYRPALILFMLPITVVALLGGKWPGLAATFNSALLTEFFLIPPVSSFAIAESQDLFQWSMLTVNGVLVALATGALRSARHGELERRRQLEDVLKVQRRNQDIILRSKNRQRHLAAIVEEVASVRDVEGLMGIVRHALRELVGADGVTLVMRENGACHYVDEDAVAPLWKGQRFPLENCVSGWAMLHAEPVVIEDIETDARIPQQVYRSTFVKSLAMVPIGRGEPVGAIGCYWANRHAATEEELELQQAVANAMAIGLDNLNLYRDMAAARRAAEASAEVAREQAKARESAQEAALQAQIKARRAALNLMDDALSARKQAEAAQEALRESERIFRLLTEQIPAIVYRAALDELSQTLYISPRIGDLGFSQEEWLADPDLWGKNLHPDDKVRVFRQLAEWRERGGPLFLEYRFRGKAGDWRYFHDLGDVITDEKGHPLYLQGLMLDVTERKAAEEQLVKLSLAIEQSPENIVITDLDARIEYVNEAFVRTTGYSRDEAVGQHLHILNSDQPHGVREAMWEALKNGRSWNGQFVSRRKDGGEYVELARLSPIHQADGTITHYLAINEDITEKQRLARELDQHRHHLEELVEERTLALTEAKSAAEAANIAKSTFLANMSHEIRTPLNAIIGFAHLLRRSRLDVDQCDKLGKLSDSAHHLLAVINDILDISKIEAGKLTIENTEFDLEHVLESTCALVANKVQSKGIELIIDTEPKLVGMFRGDPTRIGQALLNYAGNAAKFTESGAIVIRTRIQQERGDEWLVRFEVEDSGIGIAPEAQAKLFQPFEQIDSSTTRKHGGSGLGLVITKRLAQLMGGDAGVVSHLGHGSTFWFSAHLARLESQPGCRNLGDLAGRRALLVDGLPVSRNVMRKMLNVLGLHCEVADSSASAMVRMAAAEDTGNSFDFLLLDWRISGGDYEAIVSQIRCLPEPATPRHWLMLIPDDNAVRDEVRRSGAGIQLIKPVTLSTLHNALRHVLHGGDPCLPEAPSLSTAEQVLMRERAGGRVLLVEDNQINQAVVLELLSVAGLAVDVANDGAEAVKQAEATAYDLMLMDVQMPVMDGLEATRAIRKSAKNRQTPILALTASAFDEDRQRCLAAGMNDFIGKPVDPDALYKTLLKWLPIQSRWLKAIAAPASSQETSYDVLSQKLSAIPNLDFALGMKSVRGNWEAYIRLLRQYASEHSLELTLLCERLSKGEVYDIQRVAHTLKGVSATLGATSVQTLAVQLESALYERKAAPEIEQLINALKDEHTRLTEALLAALSDSDESSIEAVDWVEVKEILNQLEELLAQNNVQSNIVFRENAPLLRIALGAAASKLDREIGRFDYEAASVTLAEARTGLPQIE